MATTDRASGAPPARGPRGWSGSPRSLVAVLVCLAVVSTAVASLGAPLLPTIAAVDHVSLAASQWALTVTLLVGAVAAPLLGRLGDGSLRRPVTIAAAAAVLAGCVLSALPLGFAMLIAGRGIQGIGLGLVPLATAVARDNLPADRSRPTIALLGIMTAAGVGAGYPLAGLVAEYLGLHAAFWLGAIVSAMALAAAIAVLPASPARRTTVDAVGACLLGLGVTGVLLVLAEGQGWRWTSARTLAIAASSVAVLACWVGYELQVRSPLVELRLLRHRSVLAANCTGLLVAVGFYPLVSLVVRFVQTPSSVGYGFGAPVVVAGLMLTPFSLASFGASRIAGRLARRTSPEAAVAAGCLALIASLALFLAARGAYWEILVTMALLGLGVGCVFAINPVQIVRGVPAGETGSAMSFYQLVRTVGYSVASALSATVLIAYIPTGRAVPAAAGYSAAALASMAVLLAALVLSLGFAVLARKPGSVARLGGQAGS